MDYDIHPASHYCFSSYLHTESGSTYIHTYIGRLPVVKLFTTDITSLRVTVLLLFSSRACHRSLDKLIYSFPRAPSIYTQEGGFSIQIFFAYKDPVNYASKESNISGLCQFAVRIINVVASETRACLVLLATETKIIMQRLLTASLATIK